ncbi:MAG: M48 family metallopeptidase [Agathobacter sp.]|nr:M48 family metallopeptidase [Agathobacter sp.]
MYRENYIHNKQDEAFEQYRNGVMFQESVEKVYEEIDYKMKQPDFLGKTVKVTQKQFPEVYQIVKDLSAKEQIEQPEVYVYEDYYYGAESYGISKLWIELSAKTIQDFTKEELTFVLAREIYKIADGVTKQKTMMEQRFKAIRQMSPDEFEQVSKLSFYHWYRLANYSADNYGYLMCGSIKSSINAILMMVLNSKMLAGQVDVKEFIGQASEINKLDDMVYKHTKADESIPYAPHRIQNLLAYAVSERGMHRRITKER